MLYNFPVEQEMKYKIVNESDCVIPRESRSKRMQPFLYSDNILLLLIRAREGKKGFYCMMKRDKKNRAYAVKYVLGRP